MTASCVVTDTETLTSTSIAGAASSATKKVSPKSRDGPALFEAGKGIRRYGPPGGHVGSGRTTSSDEEQRPSRRKGTSVLNGRGVPSASSMRNEAPSPS